MRKPVYLKKLGNSLKILSLKEIKDLKLSYDEEQILSFINDINEEKEENAKDLSEEDAYDVNNIDVIDSDIDNFRFVK